MEIPYVNEDNSFTAPQHSMRKVGNILPRLIESVARAPVEDGNILFSKLDMKDGYWRIIVKKGRNLNFAYVLLDVDGARICVVIPSALQMGWSESPPFFCAATETAHEVAEDFAAQPRGSLQPHPLEYFMLPPEQMA